MFYRIALSVYCGVSISQSSCIWSEFMISLISVCFYNRKWQGTFWYHISLGTKRGLLKRQRKQLSEILNLSSLINVGYDGNLPSSIFPEMFHWLPFKDQKKLTTWTVIGYQAQVCSCLHTQKVTYRHPYSCFSSSSPNNLLNDTANTWFLDLLNHVSSQTPSKQSCEPYSKSSVKLTDI